MGRRARRAGAGRKPTRVRPGPPHTSRPDHDPRTPVHVTLRAIPTSVSLRSSRVFPHLYGALAAASFDAFRLVHFSVQSDHLHLIVEADSGPRSRARPAAARCPVRPRDQSRAWSSWLGLGRAISRASTANAARSPLGSRLRTHEFSQAPPRRARHRPVQLRALVRRLVVGGSSTRGFPPRRAGPNLAWLDWLAARRRPDRLQPRDAGGSDSGDGAAIDRRALVLEAAEHLAEVVRVREAPLAGDLFQRRARGDQHPRRLADPDLGHEASRRQAGA